VHIIIIIIVVVVIIMVFYFLGWNSTKPTTWKLIKSI